MAQLAPLITRKLSRQKLAVSREAGLFVRRGRCSLPDKTGGLLRSEPRGPGADRGYSSHSPITVGLAWMHTSLERPGPSLVNLCGVFAGTITTSPGPAARVSFPAWKLTVPWTTSQVSS